MRLFVAAELSGAVRKSIADYIHDISPLWEGVRWEREHKLHITLKFLGNVEHSVAKSASAIVGNITKEHSVMNMRSTGLGGFPNLKRPRVLYIGLSENQHLAKLHSDLENGLEQAGFEKEKRIFTPHVTIGRVKNRALIKGDIITMDEVEFDITNIAVVESKLSNSGSEYTNLAQFNLE